MLVFTQPYLVVILPYKNKVVLKHKLYRIDSIMPGTSPMAPLTMRLPAGTGGPVRPAVLATPTACTSILAALTQPTTAVATAVSPSVVLLHLLANW